MSGLLIVTLRLFRDSLAAKGDAPREADDGADVYVARKLAYQDAKRTLDDIIAVAKGASS